MWPDDLFPLAYIFCGDFQCLSTGAHCALLLFFCPGYLEACEQEGDKQSRIVFGSHVDKEGNCVVFSWDIIETHLKTWFVHTMTDCWLESWLSRTWRTKCIQMKSPVFCCNRVRKMQDRSCSDCVTVNEKKEVTMSTEFKSTLRCRSATYSTCASFEPLWYYPSEPIDTTSFHSARLSCTPNEIPRWYSC